MKKKQCVGGILALAALVTLFVWGRARFHFDFQIFAAQVALADWSKIAIAVACIYSAYVFRSAR